MSMYLNSKNCYLLVFKYGCEKQTNTTILTEKSLNVSTIFTIILKKNTWKYMKMITCLTCRGVSIILWSKISKKFSFRVIKSDVKDIAEGISSTPKSPCFSVHSWFLQPGFFLLFFFFFFSITFCLFIYINVSSFVENIC